MGLTSWMNPSHVLRGVGCSFARRFTKFSKRCVARGSVEWPVSTNGAATLHQARLMIPVEKKQQKQMHKQKSKSCLETKTIKQLNLIKLKKTQRNLFFRVVK
jgi:hypothetical protein